MNTKTWTSLTVDTIEDDLSEGQMREGGQRVGNERGGVKQLEEGCHRNHREIEQNKKCVQNKDSSS